MKRILLVLGIVLFLALLLSPSTPASAASAVCAASPTSGPLGTVFTFTCTGFLADEWTTAWATEPDGHVRSIPGVKADGTGTVSYSLTTKSSEAGLALGEWAVTVKGGESKLLGIARATLTGGTEGVSGASLVADASGMVSGSGFMPGETVSVWFDYPNGGCSGNWDIMSFVTFTGLSTVAYGNFHADADGAFSFQFKIFSDECRGTYHIVARGNASGLGGDTFWSTPNISVTETATLVANPTTVIGFGGDITFVGTGFGKGEPVSCWQTSPQGSVFPVGSTNADGVGMFTVTFSTGLDYGAPVNVQSSEGAVGEWAVTCRGNTTGAIGIARYFVTGLPVDP